MSLLKSIAVSDSAKWFLTRLLQAVLFAVFVFGVVKGSLSIAFNAGVSLLITFLPEFFEKDYKFHMDPAIVLWITLAVTFHSFGGLGYYQEFAWWDNVAHFLSSMLVAALGYGMFVSVDRHWARVDVPEGYEWLFILIFVFAMGVLWEVAEYLIVIGSDFAGIPSVLKTYGWENTKSDLVFDMLGGVAALFLIPDEYTPYSSNKRRLGTS